MNNGVMDTNSPEKGRDCTAPFVHQSNVQLILRSGRWCLVMATRNRSEDLRTNPVVDAGYSGMRKVISMGDMAPCTHVLLLTNDQSTDALFQRLLTGAGYRVTVMHELQNKRQFMALAPDVLVLDLLVSARMEEG